jgi:hypothetical protein
MIFLVLHSMKEDAFMMSRFLVLLIVSLIWCGVMKTSAVAQLTPANWDGSDGNWDDANWNGGQTAATVFGNDRVSDGAFDIMIGDGSQVTYNGAVLRDLQPRSNIGPTRMTIDEGASLTHTSIDTDVDGIWTQFDADLTLDSGTFRRTKGGTTESGGIMMLGSWRSVQNQQIDVLLTNSGRLENDGQLWFGADEEHALGLKILMVVNYGTIDLTGGTFPQDNNSNQVIADLAIFFGTDQGVGDGAMDTGLPKGEEYAINFKGPGSLTVDQSGIWIYRQDSAGIWTAMQSSYEDLWGAGILKSKGMSGIETLPGSGIPSTPFENHFTVTGTPGTNNYTLTRTNPTVVTWDGGAGVWSTDAKWNGGQTAAVALGQNNGINGGEDIVLDGSAPGGAAVTYDPNTNGDFRVGVGDGVSSLTIKNGASLSMESASDIDSKWTRYEGDLILDGGTFRRTKDGVNSLNGGLFMLGAFAQRRGMEIDVTLTNGGRIENDGQLWFGSPSPGGNATGLTVTMTINDGSIDLTGGNANAATAAPETILSVAFNRNPDLVFTHLFRNSDDNTEGPIGAAGEKYAINFTGPGSITVDQSGIVVLTENDDSGGNFSVNDTTYQELWDLGILQANGMSGLTGASFSNFFTTTGTLGSDNYMLTSLIAPPDLPGDYNNNGTVDAADYVMWRENDGSQAGYNIWRANFGSTAVGGASTSSNDAVPEAATLIMILTGTLAMFSRRRTVVS